MTFLTRKSRGAQSTVVVVHRQWGAVFTNIVLLLAMLTGTAVVQVSSAPPAAAAATWCPTGWTLVSTYCLQRFDSGSATATIPSWARYASGPGFLVALAGGGGGGHGANTGDWGEGGGGWTGTVSFPCSNTGSVTVVVGRGGDAGPAREPGGAGGDSAISNCSGSPQVASGAAGGDELVVNGSTRYGGRGGFTFMVPTTRTGIGGGGNGSITPNTAGQPGNAGVVALYINSGALAGAPSTPSITVDSSQQATVSWSGSITAYPPVTDYTATCTASGGTTRTGTGSSSPITVASLTPGVTYTCTVAAVSDAGTGASSSPSNAALVPGSPQNTAIPSFTGTAAFKTPAEVLTGVAGTWNTFGITPTTYAYLWQSLPSCTGSSWTDAAGSTKTQSNYTIVSGDVGNCLRLQVTATNTYGSTSAESAQSEQVTTTPVFTAQSPPVIADAAVTSPSAPGYFAGYTFAASGNRIAYTIDSSGSLTGLPTGMSIIASTGAITGTPNAGTAGVYTYRVVATNASGSATTATLTLTISNGTPAQITIATQPVGGMASGTALTTQPVVELKDSSGRLIAQPQAIVATASGGTLGGTTSVTTVNGVSTYTNLTLAGLTNTNYTLTFTRSSVTAVSNAIQVMSGALASISVTTQPVAAAAAGDLLATQPVVTLRDAQTNVIDDRSSTVVVTSELASGGAGGALGGTTTLTTTTGVATFTNLTFGGTVSTNYKLKFTSGAITALSGNISNTQAGAPTQLFIQTQPTIGGTDVVGSAFATQPVVRILDAGGNLTTSTATVTATASGGTLSGTTSIPAVAGTATYTDLSFAGLVSTPYTLTFASTGLTSATSSSFQYGAGRFGPVSLTISTITASPTSRPADGSSTSGITVQTKDAGGNNLTTSQGPVTLATTAGSLGSVTNNNNGSYSATLTTPVGRGSGSAVVSGTLNGSALLSTATVSLFDAQTITFAQPANVPLGTLPYQLVASASSGLPVVFSLGSGTTNSACSVTAAGVVTINAVGSCEIQADQAGSAIYWPAPQVVRTYAVAATTPTAPFITSVTEGNGQATVAFTPPGFDGGATITNYEYSLDGGVNWTPLSPTDALSPVTIPSLTNLTGYQVSLRAVNSAGAGLASSASPAFTPRASGGTTVTAATTTPSAPRNPETLSQSEGAVTVSWQEPQSNGGATITSYTVEVAPSGTCTATIAATSRVGSCTIGGLVPGRAYTFTIRAVNSNGAGTAAVISYLVPGGPGPAPTITLTLDPNGGTCTVGSISGPATSWGALPSASQCSRTSAILTGWKPVYSTTLYAPGTQVQFIDNNTLRAVWLTSQGPASTPGASVTPRGQVRWVVWTADGKHVRAGRPKEMLAHHPVVTIVTRDSAKVTRQQIDTARSMAREYEGVYAGVVRANWWNRPRIVAAYVASTETAQ